MMKVYVNAKERDEIEAKAASYGMSVSGYLRVVGVNPDMSRGMTVERLNLFRRHSKAVEQQGHLFP